MTFDQFITKWTGKHVDFDGIYPDQCMDLSHQYVYDVLGVTDKTILARPWAAQVYTNFTWPNLFEKTANSATNIPQKGDIIIWDEQLNFDTAVGHGYGHIAIVIDANVDTFNSFDANFPTGSLPHVQKHSYNHVLGWLRFKPQVSTTTGLNTYGLDDTNVQSKQIVYDAWHAVTTGQYVSLADMNSICTTLGIPTGSNKDVINSAIQKLQNEKATAEKNNANLNKRIPELEGQISTLEGQVLTATTDLETLKNQADQHDSFQGLYEQAEIDLKTARQQRDDSVSLYNRTVAQYQKTSALNMPKTDLWWVAIARTFNFPLDLLKKGGS